MNVATFTEKISNFKLSFDSNSSFSFKFDEKCSEFDEISNKNKNDSIHSILDEVIHLEKCDDEIDEPNIFNISDCSDVSFEFEGIFNENKNFITKKLLKIQHTFVFRFFYQKKNITSI